MSKITKESFEAFVQKEFPGREYKWDYHNNQGYMYIQAGTVKKFSGSDVHYEFYDGQVRVHIEGERWLWLRNELYNSLHKLPELMGTVWNKRQNCQWILISQEDDIFNLFRKIRDVVEPALVAYENGIDYMSSNKDNVSYSEYNVNDIYHLSLCIPDYQRIYSWEEEKVKNLLDDIANIKISHYHIGAIILHKNCEKYDIVDGQQRLVTLAIIKYVLNPEDNDVAKFLDNEYNSIEAQNRIRLNHLFIINYFKKNQNKEIIRNNIQKVLFSVLIISDNEHLDLAFHFFSNTNSRGKKLTDYDLLKPHHLRYIPSDLVEQQMHLSKMWDKMISRNRYLERDYRTDIDYVRVFELCLFRLRKWSYQDSCDISTDHYLKKEFEAAPIIDEIPPFGEKFSFNEPIQGGQHFFAYVETFLEKYKNFPQKTIIKELFGREGSHSWYGNVIEALSFCYYVKFGEAYSNEALMSIVRYVSAIRFSKGKAKETTILKWVCESKIVLMIEHATSPTLFLASIEKAIDYIRTDEIEEAIKGIRKDFYERCKRLSEQLSKESNVQYYKDYFKKRYENGTICINS